MVDYSKWKDIEVSDDEDDTHPNIDTPSLFRWRHEARVQRMEELRLEKEELEKSKCDVMQRKAEAASRKETGEDVTKLMNNLIVEEQEVKKKEVEFAKKEKMTPWNVDTIGSDGFSKTVINQPKKRDEKKLTEEEQAERFRIYTINNEKLLKEFGMLKKYDDSKKFLLEHPHLACDDTSNYLVYWCIDLAIEEKFDLMDHVSHQCICIQFLLELAKQLDLDPRSCINPFFTKIGLKDQTDYKDAFSSELEMLRQRIRTRAEHKVNEAMEKEREERLGPGGLDPLEVLESLPLILQKCFEEQDIPMLQKAIKELPEEEATYHMKRCVDSGLWVPAPSKDKPSDSKNNEEDGEEAESKKSETKNGTKETEEEEELEGAVGYSESSSATSTTKTAKTTSVEEQD